MDIAGQAKAGAFAYIAGQAKAGAFAYTAKQAKTGAFERSVAQRLVDNAISLCQFQESRSLVRGGISIQQDVKPDLFEADARSRHVVTTILPTCSFDSMYRCASTIWSSVNVRAMTGFSLPDAS